MPTTLETDDPLVHPLNKLRGLVRRYVLLDGLFTAGLFAILWYWIGLAFDYGLFKFTHFDWVLDAPKLLRVAAFAALALLLVAILFTRLYLRLTRELSYRSLALLLEKRFPKILGDKLITAVELADVPKAKAQGYSEEMLRSVIEDARVAVDQVPVASVFNWKRLTIKAMLLGLFAVGTLIAVFLGYCAVTQSVEPGTFASRFGDVSLIWADRNLLLRNTPWPRQAHLELIDFESEEKRVGRDAPPPRISVRAYQWVVVDRGNPHGWRPMQWADVSKYFSVVPSLEQTLQDNGKPFPSKANQWDVDSIEALGGKTLSSFFAELTSQAEKQSNTLTLRKLPIPEEVTLVYSGAQSYGKVTLTREANNVFTGEIPGLRESIRFTVKGSDFSTTPRSIVLVPPPMLSRLARTEYQPAYLHHAPPLGSDDYRSLRGLKQTMPEKELSLTGDKTILTIVKGTEFDLSGTADKKLSKVYLKPKLGPLPGMLGLKIVAFGPRHAVVALPKKATASAIAIENGDSFRVSFRGLDAPTANLEFDVVIVDDEGVVTPRTVLVQVTDDQAPSVELAVDILRKSGNDYLVTPAAMVPFLAESKVRDDLALGRVEFVYSASQIESGISLSLQAQTITAMFASPPLMPAVTDLYLPWAMATFAQANIKPEKREIGAVLVPRYESLFKGLKRDDPATLRAKLANPLDVEQAPIIREIKFGNQSADIFDLRAALPRLASNFETAEATVRFRVELALRATDANVDSGPKTAENLEPVRLIVISEADLLTEMSRDEESQATKLDEVIKKLLGAQTKLNTTADRLVPLSLPPDLIASSAVRMTDIAQDFAKAREITTGVLNEYRKLRREAEFNRVGFSTGAEADSLYLKRVDQLLKRLDDILENSFADLEQKHQLVQTQLGENRRPDDNVVTEDRFALAKLIREIEDLRRDLGEAVSLSKLRSDLSALRDKQIAIGKILKAIKEFEVGKLYLPELLPLPTIELAKGESKKITQKVNWKTYSASLSVKFEGPGDYKVKVPEPVRVAEERDDFDYTLVAGQVPGEYTIRLTPTAGAPVNVTVRVK